MNDAARAGNDRPAAGLSLRRLIMVTRSVSPGLLGLEPAGPRLVLAVARLPDEAIAFLANPERWTRSAAARPAGLFAAILTPAMVQINGWN